MKHISQILLVLLLGWAIAGCSTVEGLGKDLKKGGEAIEKAARQ